jgi:hypothetical protein
VFFWAYWCWGLGSIPEVVSPSPKSQRQLVIAHGPDTGVDVLVKFTFLLLTEKLKFAVGWTHGLGDGLGGGADGDGLGDTPGEGEGTGEGLGEGDGLGDGGPPGAAGMLTMSAVDDPWRVMFDPPVKTDINGVRRAKWPLTVTVTRFAGTAPLAQDGEHASATSPGTIVTKDPWASFVAAHMTRFDVALHALADWNEVGSAAASNAAARAAFVTVIRA